MSEKALKCEKKTASKVHAYLKENFLMENRFRAKPENEFVFFPVKKLSLKQKSFLQKTFSAVIVSEKLEKHEKQKPSLKEALAKQLSKKEMKLLVTSFDSLGDIAIIEVPDELEKKEQIIGQTILDLNKGIKTVCKKTAAHSGEFRIEPVKVIAGKKNLKATYRESGCVFKISLGKVFFSPRLATERLRIAKQIKKGEIVGALFAGVGPFPIVFAKNSGMKKAFAVELNPAAVRDMEENVILNKVEKKVEVILGDVRKIVGIKLAKKCDRVVMPLPKGGETFLGHAMKCIKPEGGIIHFYDFVDKEKPFEEAVKKIRRTALEEKMRLRVLRKKKVRDYSPFTVQVVVDFWVKPLKEIV